MHEEKIEGIVLRSMEYKEKQRIITLFSQEMGIISLIIKRLSKNNYHLLSLSTPFTQGEFIYQKTNSDLSRFIDGTILDEHLQFRQKFSFLQTAGLLTQAIAHSQMPGKPAPALYMLLKSYFKQIPSFEKPDALISSFYLKLLRHEGLLALSNNTLSLSREEWILAQSLATSQHFNHLRPIHLPEHFLGKIIAHFQELH